MALSTKPITNITLDITLLCSDVGSNISRPYKCKKYLRQTAAAVTASAIKSMRNVRVSRFISIDYTRDYYQVYTGSMKLTKYSHACLVLEDQGFSLVIDPGNFSTDFVVPENVAGVIITHSHADHYDEGVLYSIISKNPQAQLYGLDEIADVSKLPITSVTPGRRITIGPFELEFTGGEHATIHPDMKPVGNIGVIVNSNLFYYPGDSFTQPPRHMKWIATPVAAPWLKISETVEFLRKAAPDYAFPRMMQSCLIAAVLW